MKKEIEKYHFIGIGGIGMSALARILLDKKVYVSGSDLSSNANTLDLLEKGAVVHKGNKAHHVSKESIVVYSSDIKVNNPEYQAALEQNCKILHRSELLAHLMSGRRAIAVTGTHGKTTTTSLVTHILIEAEHDPSFAIGGMYKERNGKWGRGPHFVAEADESDGTFLNYQPYAAIVTNIEEEHMAHFRTKEALLNAFASFMERVQDKTYLFYCADDEELDKLAKKHGGVSYGFSAKSDVHICSFKQQGWQIVFDLKIKGRILVDLSLPLIGKHNALNAAAAVALCLQLGVSEEVVRKALKSFPGVARRCQKRNELSGVLLIDDYGHHPTEVYKTIEAVKNASEERRLVVLFQPHRYSRVGALIDEFGKAFSQADHVFVTDIYGAGEENPGNLSAEHLVKKIQEYSHVPCTYVPREHCRSQVEKLLKPHDVFLTMGAGDITHLHNENWSIGKWRVGLIFGGASCEHEISLRSSRYVMSSLNPDFYEVTCFGIDKAGKWVVGESAKKILLEDMTVSSPECVSMLDPRICKEIMACDLFLPILHGTYGEDGSIQGFFEMIGKPYVGPDLRSAAIAMDKILTKRLVESAGVLTPKDVSFTFIEWQKEKSELLKEIEKKIPFPVYVKPTHLGSSVGIQQVERMRDLEEAIEYAFRFDYKVMVEEGKVGCRELEFAVIGNSMGYQVLAPPPGEKLAGGTFVDYEKKYGTNAVKTDVNPFIESDILAKGRSLAKKAYLAVGCSGMTRVDFLLDSEGNYWFFEMNTIPGMQKLSLFPKIWNREGLAPEHLFNRLIVLALQRRRQQDRHFSTL